MVAAPPRSAQRSNGPAGCPAPSRSARSMSSSPATPSSRARYASLTIASSIRSTIRSRSLGSSVAGGRLDGHAGRVRVEAGASLASQPLRLDLALLQYRRPEPIGQRVASRLEPLVDPARGGEADVDAGEVHQLERAHRIARRPHRRIDLRDARLPGFEHRQRFERERPVDAIDDEARRVLGHDRRLAPALHQRDRPLHRIGVRLRRANDLDERHQRGRVEEMEPEHVLRPAGRDRDRGHRQRARVRRQERVRRRLPVERTEDRPLEVEVLDRRLDGDVGRRGDRVERHRRPQVRKSPVDPLVDRIRVELELRGPPAKADPDPLHPCLERLFVDVVEHDLVARFERDLGDPRAHRPGADDADDGAGQVVGSVRLVHGLTVRQRSVRPARSPASMSAPSTVFEGTCPDRSFRST